MLAPPARIVEALRDYGLVVVEDPGWEARGTGYRFEPFGQAWHHDAFTEDVSDARALEIMRKGRPDLRGPLCNGWVDSDSRIVLVAYGNANHAGWNEADVIDRLRRGLAPLGDARADPDGDSVVGNPHLWGWECRNAGDGTDVWDQLDAMERAGAALCDANGWPAAANAAHRELTARKPDPRGFDMVAFRADIARHQISHSRPPSLPEPCEETMYVIQRRTNSAHRLLVIDVKDGEKVLYKGHAAAVTVTAGTPVVTVDDTIWNDVIKRLGPVID